MVRARPPGVGAEKATVEAQASTHHPGGDQSATLPTGVEKQREGARRGEGFVHTVWERE